MITWAKIQYNIEKTIFGVRIGTGKLKLPFPSGTPVLAFSCETAFPYAIIGKLK